MSDVELVRRELHQVTEFLLGRVYDIEFVGNTPQESVINEIPRFKVGGEDYELIKRYLNPSCR